jgi:hypothetical protein
MEAPQQQPDRPSLAPFHLPPMHGRKRASMDRRHSPSTNNESSMHLSPHMSPNSFLTMDGRFVQSKNPFSSPMMMDDDTLWATAAAPGPSMPVSFYPSDAKNESMALIPPRSRPALTKRNPSPPIAMGDASLFSGFPDKRFSFTGSPIHENMETEMANSTGMHKVRRLHRNDDIVAAGYRPSQYLTVDTRHSPTQKHGMDDGISPTEVCNFPPPTPVKIRPNQSAYASIRVQEPATPFAERRTASNSCRTPHPGSYINNTDEMMMMSNEPKSRFHTDFDIIEEIGKGCFGTVYKVLSRLDGCMYAIKKGRRSARGEMEKDRMLKEVCWKRDKKTDSVPVLYYVLSHPFVFSTLYKSLYHQVYALAALSDQADTATFHIVRYHQAWMEDNLLYIQTELCSSTLTNEIAMGPLSDRRRYKLLREMLLALEFIHRQEMIHLDIKPENIMLKNDQYKLGDFGLVTRASFHEDVEEGDSRYMSMELLSGDHKDLTKSDIFSLGATLYEICLGRPLPMDGQEWQDIRAGRLSPLPNTRQDMAAIIAHMMDPVAANRPTASKLLEHPQLLSDEQKALFVEKSKVVQANMQLAAQARHMNAAHPLPVMKRGLVRANTWSGGPLPYL